MERQIQMQNAMRERQMAMQIARGRDLFQWWAAFYSVAALGGILGWVFCFVFWSVSVVNDRKENGKKEEREERPSLLCV